MKYLIVEDEFAAAEQLKKLLHDLRPAWQLMNQLDSVRSTVDWLKNNAMPDVLFFDIQLSDGRSFEIFEQVEVQAPVIFTTAYNQYAVDAFRVNSVHYLLKPIGRDALQTALQKFERQQTPTIDPQLLQQLFQNAQKRNYKSRFLVKTGDQFVQLPTSEVAYFTFRDGYVEAINRQGKSFLLDYSLDQVGNLVDPDDFFRINRKYLVRPDAIRKIVTWFTSRLKLELEPASPEEVIVSRDRVNDFKAWLDR